jgi:hypothetical protein
LRTTASIRVSPPAIGRMKLMVCPTVVMFRNVPKAEVIAIAMAESAHAINAWPETVSPNRARRGECGKRESRARGIAFLDDQAELLDPRRELGAQELDARRPA